MDMYEQFYYLNSDDSGHWYIVPIDDQLKFEAWVLTDGAEELPGGIKPVNGSPCRVKFTNPILDF